MSSAHSVPKPSPDASDNQKRPPSNTYAGGDWFVASPPSLQPNRAPHPPQLLSRATQPPPPSPPPSAPHASDSAPNGPSVFQPRHRGQRYQPPQYRKPTNAGQQEPSFSRTRRLPAAPIYMNNDALRTFQSRSAKTLNFSEVPAPLRFKNSAPPPPPAPARHKLDAHVVNLDDDTAPTAALTPYEKPPQLERNPISSLHNPFQRQDDLPRVPKKEVAPSKNSSPDVKTFLNHTREAANSKAPVRLKTVRPNRPSEQPKRSDMEAICVEDDPHPVVPQKPRPNLLPPQRPIVLPSRSASPAPRSTPTAKRQLPSEDTRTLRKRPRPNSSQATHRRSLRLQDKHKPDSTISTAMIPFSQSFNTATQRCSPDSVEIPRSVATKPPRAITPSDSDDNVTVVQSKSIKREKRRIFVPYERTSLDYQQTLSQLRNGNTRYIKLSFSGISDGDLRNLFDVGINMPDLPSGGRHIELNNNRLCRITSHMFQRFRDMKVISLILSSNLLTQIDQSLVFCTELKTLDLSRNNLRSLPEQLGDLSNLLFLKVSDNKLTKLPSLYLLRKLQILNVARNNLESFPEDVTEAGNALTALDISGNQGFQSFPACCKNWTRLEDLILTGTEIFVYLTKKERKMRPKALIEELAGKSLEQLKNRTRKRKPPSRYRESSEATTTVRKAKSVVEV